MAGWLHGVFVGAWLFVFPLCGFSLSLFCNYGSRLKIYAFAFSNICIMHTCCAHPWRAISRYNNQSKSRVTRHDAAFAVPVLTS